MLSCGASISVITGVAPAHIPDKYTLTGAEKAALLRALRRIYKWGDEREFMKILRKHGIKDEDPRFSEIVKPFRALHGKT
jgi:hypothetical protein